MYFKAIKFKQNLFIFFLFTNLTLNAQTPGSIDTTFNKNDLGQLKANGTYSDFSANILSVALQNDGKIIIGGDFSEYKNVVRKNIARLKPDGNIDSSFNSSIGANAPVTSLAIQNDGKIIIGGDFTKYNSLNAVRVARLNTNGSLDTTFNSKIGADNRVNAIAIQTDGKIIVAGYFTTYGGAAKNKIVRLNQDGSIDTSFDPGNSADQEINAAVIQADGKILIGGRFEKYNGKTSKYIARINQDGSFDNTFNTGLGFDNDVCKMAIQADGKIIAIGFFDYYNNVSRLGIVRINTNGSIDNTFTPGSGITGNGYANALIIQADGKIIVGGNNVTTYNGVSAKSIFRLNSDGSMDNTFSSGTGLSNSFYSINNLAIKNDGKIIIVGRFNSYNGFLRDNIAKLNNNGSINTSFNPLVGANNIIYSIVYRNDGKIYIGGLFTRYDDKIPNGVARLNADGSIDTTFNSGSGLNTNAAIKAMALQTDGKLIVGGSFTSYNGTAINRIARLNTDGTIDNSFNIGLGANDVVEAIAIRNDGKIYIAGQFTSYNGITRNRIACLISDGSLDNVFNPVSGANNSVNAIAIQTDNKIIIGGSFTDYNGSTKNRIARIMPDGSLDNFFFLGTGFNGNIYTIVIQSDGKILMGGGYTTYNGTTANSLVRLNTDASIDNAFIIAYGTYDIIYSIAVQNNGKIIIGGKFTSYNGLALTGIARLNINNTLDNTFNLNGQGINFGTAVFAMAQQPDGKTIIGGSFTSYRNKGKSRIVRIFTNDILGTSVLNNKKEINLKAYPIPFNTAITIENPDSNEELSYTITNLLGELIVADKFNSNKIEIDLSNYSNGLYFLNANSSKGSALLKLVKQ